MTRLVNFSVVSAMGAFGVCGKGVGDGGESIYFQHKKPNCKAAYLFQISHTKMF